MSRYSIVHKLYDEFDSWDVCQQDYLDFPLDQPTPNYYEDFTRENLLLAYGGEPKIEVFVEANDSREAFNKGYDIIVKYEKEQGIYEVNSICKEIENILGFLNDKEYCCFFEERNLRLHETLNIKYFEELKEYYGKIFLDKSDDMC